MSASYCSTACGDTLEFPATYVPQPTELDPCPEAETRSCCVKRIALVMCDSAAQPADLTNTTSIEALKTAGKLISFSDVGVTFNTPTSTLYTKPCGEEIVVRKEQLIDVEVFDVSEDHEDEQFFNALCKLNNKFGFVYQYEDGYTALADDWIDWFLDGAIGDLPDTQMGIPVSFSIDPYLVPFNRDEPCRWRFQLKVMYDCVLRSALIPAFQGTI